MLSYQKELCYVDLTGDSLTLKDRLAVNYELEKI
jgi:hypothetical protein